MFRSVSALIGFGLLVVGCAGFETTAADLESRLSEIDVGETLSDLTDCDALSATFVKLVQTAADNIDNLSEVTNGEVPESEIRDVVDDLAVSQYYEVAEKLGCAKIQMELVLVNRILEIDTETADGDLFIDQILEEAQTPLVP
ncbi:MAG TPA: hypothetical protein VIW94_04445 [Acidimicrobiia bacterium]